MVYLPGVLTPSDTFDMQPAALREVRGPFQEEYGEQLKRPVALPLLCSEDFGSQGAFPSHPDLLDWLAVDFRASGWDIKRMLKLIVMSSTYRQSSNVTREAMGRDPDNRLVSRGLRFRLQAEFIRDNALAVSGLLVPDQGGPGGRVYQSAGLWAEVGRGGVPEFVQDHGKTLYRRSL